MTPELTDDMVADMDETADFMHAKPVFAFPPSGIKHGRPAKFYKQPGLVTPYSRGISITGREQGQRDADKRDALRRGGR
jgi:hypothetical protein